MRRNHTNAHDISQAMNALYHSKSKERKEKLQMGYIKQKMNSRVSNQ
jgi:hypothetical protein